MTSKVFTTSAIALMLFAAAGSQAFAAPGQWDRRGPYANEGRRGYVRYAFENGERDGYNKGLDDLRHHRAPNVQRQKWYRNGDHNYDREFGSREEYRIEYRRGFREGYDRAYRSYREGTRWRY